MSGVFATHGIVNDDVDIRFMVIPEGSGLSEPPVYSVSIPHTKLLPNDDPSAITTSEFDTTVPLPSGVSSGTKVRVIGISVVAKRADDPTTDPPGFETFTWCVGRTVP